MFSDVMMGLFQIMVIYPPQPAEPVTAGFNEETGDPVEITVSWIFILKRTMVNSMTLTSMTVH